ncbi:unnamed protein product [Schistosoma bovis]|nr:unnamed protein product [Schistosoma bovis]
MTGIFKRLKCCGQPIALKVLNEFLKYNVKFTKTKTTIEFINRCIESGHYPKLYYTSLRRNGVYPNRKTLKRHSLNQIDALHSDINEIQMNVFLRKYAVDDLTDDLKIPFMDYVTNLMDQRSRKKLIQLLKGLENQTAESKFPTNSKRYVHNFSSVELDKEKLEVLSLGLKFCDTRNNCNRIDTDIQFENLYSQTRDLVVNSDQQLEHFKSTLVDCCYQYKNNKFSYKSILTKKHKEAINLLLKDETLLVTKPDKGSGVVLLNKSDYIEKK